jgi:hypothetical protein
MLRVLGLSLLCACSLIFPSKQTTEKPKAPTREDIDVAVRAELDQVPGDACAKAAWLAKQTDRDGLRGEVIEEIQTKTVFACKQLHAPRLAATTTTEEPAVELTFDVPCTRKDIEAKLREVAPKKLDDPKTAGDTIEDAFARCFATKVKECQTALDAEVDEGVACWRKQSFTEVPKSVDAGDVGATTMCLGELKAVVSDLRACGKKKPAERDACVSPYVGYVPKCPLLDPNRAWTAFPGHADVERVANADAKKKAEREEKVAKEKAEREARIAKEAERCFGRSTIEVAQRLHASPGPRTFPGCTYKVEGKVVSHNNVYVQLADPTGTLVMLLRTREAFTDGAVLAGERSATFDTLEEAEMEDGSKQSFPVFKLPAK